MSPHKLNQPLTRQATWRILGTLVLAAGLFYGARSLYDWLQSGPPSPRQVKNSIRKFLKRQTGDAHFKTDFDFALKETVTKMQTNVIVLKQQIGTLQGLFIQGSNLGQFVGPPLIASLVAASGHWHSALSVTLTASALGIVLGMVVSRLRV